MSDRHPARHNWPQVAGAGDRDADRASGHGFDGESTQFIGLSLERAFRPAHADCGSRRGHQLAGEAPYDGPVLWVAGGRSSYITAAYAAAMDRWFPTNRKVTIKDAGHWVHSEQPEIFLEVLRRFAEGRG